MKKKLMAFCTVIVVVSVVFTVSGVGVFRTQTEQDISYAQRSQYYNEADDMNTTMNEVADLNSTTAVTNPVGGFVDSKLEGFSSVGSIVGDLLGGGDSDDGGFLGSGGGVGDAIGGIGDLFGGILGGNSDETTPGNNVVTYPSGDNPGGYIDPVPAATFTPDENDTPSPSLSPSPSPSVPSAQTGSNASVSQGASQNNNSTTNPYQKPAGTINPGDSGEGVKWLQWVFFYTGYGLDEKDITGEYDEKTQKLVEKLQKEKGLTVDGVVNDAVIDKIELLYYEHMITDTTTVAGVITLPNTLPTTGEGAEEKSNNSFSLAIAIVAAIWCVAIIIILVVYLLKKKGQKTKDKTEDKTTQSADTTDSSESTENSEKTESSETQKDKVMSLSDLFEEANK